MATKLVSVSLGDIDFAQFVQILKRDKKIKIKHVGTFEIKPLKRKTFNHPVTQKPFKALYKHRIVFVSSKTIKDICTKK